MKMPPARPSRPVRSLSPLLSHLWLHEPDADTIARAVSELGLPDAESTDLASAYTDIFLLNVYPYGTAFTDPFGELNGPEAQRVAALYEAHGYYPSELSQVGAPDHLGLCLGFLSSGMQSEAMLPHLLEWAPVCCLSVEREPSAHAFYRALASTTRQHLLVILSQAQPLIPETLRGAQGDFINLQSKINNGQSEDEVRLRDIVRFLLAPAQCGVFLSRSRLGRLARTLGLRLPFGSRFEVAEMLFASAGEREQVGELLSALEAEVNAWAREYHTWAEKYAEWQPSAGIWLARTHAALQAIAGLRHILEMGLSEATNVK